ncbi:MAG: putative membrane protein [Phormidium sp. OSCR]|nr:MAG: putative membrane protein [Phormidium sp. OSCR]
MSVLQEAKVHFEASHQHPINQVLHHITNFLALSAIGLLWFNPKVSIIFLVISQIFAWGGHAVFEKNHPAFFKYPGITILASFAWSFERWFGFRQLLVKGDRNPV